MTPLIVIDDGHGINTPGKRTGALPDNQKSELGLNYMNENLFNRAVAKHLDYELTRHGFKTLLSAPTDEDTPLKDRVNTANKANADLFISIHANANTGKWGNWGGIETFTYGSGEGLRIGKLIHSELIKGTPLTDRGVKNGAHLYVIKNTKMPSVLVECGFMDSLYDYKYLLSDAYRKECAIEICKGICKAFSVLYVAEQEKTLTDQSKANTGQSQASQVHYRVIVGSFKTKNNATAQLNKIKASGFEAFIAKEDELYRVIGGSFINRANAEALVSKLKQLGFSSFLMAHHK